MAFMTGITYPKWLVAFNRSIIVPWAYKDNEWYILIVMSTSILLSIISIRQCKTLNDVPYQLPNSWYTVRTPLVRLKPPHSDLYAHQTTPPPVWCLCRQSLLKPFLLLICILDWHPINRNKENRKRVWSNVTFDYKEMSQQGWAILLML